MTSTFTWLDTSEHDRRRALDVIDLLSLQTTRDELGIATVRDSLADQLSPGTSTIQTRARYFLFIPWIYQRLEERKIPASEVATQLRRRELALIYELVEATDSTGTIGSDAKTRLKRFASSIYWYGLWAWGIRLFPGSLERYHATFGRPRQHLDSLPDDEAPPTHWHPHIPKAPPNFPGGATFELTVEESEYLIDRLRARTTGSLLHYLVDLGETTEAVSPWEHPALDDAPSQLQELVEHAHNFSELFHGAALLYNLMLAEKRPLEERKAEYRDRLTQWSRSVSDRRHRYAAWNRQDFWYRAGPAAGRKIPSPTRAFCDTWIELALDAGDPAARIDDDRARRLLQDRERRLKRHRARLIHREYLELWSGAAGTDPLDYRWRVTQLYAREILTPLVGATKSAAKSHAQTA